jgi:hypothetical protein
VSEDIERTIKKVERINIVLTAVVIVELVVLVLLL